VTQSFALGGTLQMNLSIVSPLGLLLRYEGSGPLCHGAGILHNRKYLLWSIFR